jgi:hypothetical protein
MHRSRNATPNIAPTTQCAQDLQSSALQECISKRSNAQIKECNSKHRPNNATPNIAPTTRHRSQLHSTVANAGRIRTTTRHSRQRGQDLKQQLGISDGARTDQSRNIQNKACIAFPHTTRMHFQILKCTDQGMQLQTSPQQCNSKHRPNNSAPFPATQPNNSAHFPTRALPNSTYRTRKTTPTETRTRSKVRSLPPHLHTVSLHLLYYVTFRELPSIPLIR